VRARAVRLLPPPKGASQVRMKRYHEPQSLWFCGFAILTLSWGVGLIAYGLYFFDEEF
jgi:hypothetical protein